MQDDDNQEDIVSDNIDGDKNSHTKVARTRTHTHAHTQHNTLNTSYVVRMKPSVVLGSWFCSQAKSYKKCTYAPSLGSLSNTDTTHAAQHLLTHKYSRYSEHTHTVKEPVSCSRT